MKRADFKETVLLEDWRTSSRRPPRMEVSPGGGGGDYPTESRGPARGRAGGVAGAGGRVVPGLDYARSTAGRPRSTGPISCFGPSPCRRGRATSFSRSSRNPTDGAGE